MTDGIVMKGKRIIILFQLQKQILQHLNSNHMEIEKMRLLACKLKYCLGINSDIENTVK